MKAIYGSSLSSLVKIDPIMQEEMSFESIVDDRLEVSFSVDFNTLIPLLTPKRNIPELFIFSITSNFQS